MPRNLDLTSLRSFVAVAEIGGVTKAAGLLNLTQSAVSMQLKRLEESLGIALFDRTGRSLIVTPAGEQLVGLARRMLELNDEVFARLTSTEFEGELTIGVPHDIVHPLVPQVLRQFSADYPRVKVRLISSFTKVLKPALEAGEMDLILTTEPGPTAESKTIAELPLLWVGAVGGQAWRRRPLNLAHEQNCLFRPTVQRALDDAEIPWVMAVDSQSFRASEAMVSADLAVHTLLEGTLREDMEVIRHNGVLPDLGAMQVNLYKNPLRNEQVLDDLSSMIQAAFGPRPVSLVG